MKFKCLENKLIRGVLAGVLAAVVALGFWFSGVTGTWEAKSWDWRVRLMAEPGKSTSDICLILLDQQSLDWAKEVNGLTWPWPREIYGAIVDFCKRKGARAMAFDVLFTEDSKYGVQDDAAFAKAIAEFDHVVLPLFLSNQNGEYSQWPEFSPTPSFQVAGLDPWDKDRKGKIPTYTKSTMPIEALARETSVLGSVDLQPDPDGIYRRADLLNLFGGRAVPSLGLGLYLAQNPGITLAVGPGVLTVGEREIPIDSDGNTLLRYRGASGVHKTFSAAAVLQSEIQIRNGEPPNIDDPEALSNKTVLFGFSAPGLYDLRPSPTSGVYPGVEIHATLLDNLLSDDFMRSTPTWAVVFQILILSIVCAVSMTWVTKVAGHIATILVFLFLPVSFAFGAYQQGYWLPLIAPEISILLATGLVLLVNYAIEGRQKRFIKSAFNHFLSPAVINQLIADPERLKLGGQRRTLSIFFSDLQGFTSISEKMEPEALIQLLNDYLTEMTDIIHAEGGTIDKYEGDAIIAFWNAPLEIPNHAAKAVQAALRCQKRLARLRPVFKERAGAELHMRIGINTGTAVVGNLGSDTRFDYTMIGDAVNLAARLEGANKQFNTFTMISQPTFDLVREHIKARELARLTVVGRDEPVTVFEPMIPEDYDKKMEILETFQRGLVSFYKGDMSRAEKIFTEIVKSDSAARSYAKKCHSLSKIDPQNWQGVWVMTTK